MRCTIWREAVIHPQRSPGAMILDVESSLRTRPDRSRERYERRQLVEQLLNAAGRLVSVFLLG